MAYFYAKILFLRTVGRRVFVFRSRQKDEANDPCQVGHNSTKSTTSRCPSPSRCPSRHPIKRTKIRGCLRVPVWEIERYEKELEREMEEQ